MDFKVIANEEEFVECARVIRAAYLTVAAEFNITEQNAPTYAAFNTVEKLKNEINKPVRLFGLFDGGKQVGCVALERSHDEKNVFFLERLAVLPEERHKGYGAALLDFAFKQAKMANGVKVKIGIIDENRVLKEWYIGYGFSPVGTKVYPHLPFTVCFMEKGVG
jgi:GNAT superfamily N-acetyltransferase